MIRSTMPILLLSCVAALACDEPRPDAKAEPIAPASPPASSAPAVQPPAVQAIADPPVAPSAPPDSAPPEDVQASPAPSAVASGASSAPAKPAGSVTPPDPNNPCATRYEERANADGTVTRVLIPKDKRCGLKREGGLSSRGDVFGY